MLQRISMRRLTAMVLCVILFLTFAIPTLAAYPTHTDYISDPDSVLSDTTISAIKTTNDTLYTNRGVQIGVCITAGTGDESITDFSRTLFTKWEMCDGVLLVLDTTNQTYFAVQSVDIDDTITNAVLSDLLNTNMEEDFVAGNIDRAVMKTVTALSQTMTSLLPDPSAAADQTSEDKDAAATEPEEADKPSGFVTFMKVVLWIIIIAVVLAVAIFVVALFNEDVGDFVRTYVFRRGPVTGNYGRGQVPHPGYYDDRLYGNGQRNRQNGQRQPGYGNGSGYGSGYGPGYGGQQNRNPNGGQYRQQGQYPQNRNQGYRQNSNAYDPYNDYEAQYQYQGQSQYQGQRRPQNGNRQGQPRNGQNPNGYRGNGQYNNRNY